MCTWHTTTFFPFSVHRKPRSSRSQPLRQYPGQQAWPWCWYHTTSPFQLSRDAHPKGLKQYRSSPQDIKGRGFPFLKQLSVPWAPMPGSGDIRHGEGKGPLELTNEHCFRGETTRAAEKLVAALRVLGIRYMFGIPGGAWIPCMEAMRTGGVEFLLVANEASGGISSLFSAAAASSRIRSIHRRLWLT